MESSVIFQGITEKQGPVSLLVKGYKRPKSRLRGEIDILTLSEVIFYPKPTREVHTVKEAKMKKMFYEIYKNYKTLEKCLNIGNILLKTIPNNKDASSFFALYYGLLEETNSKNGECTSSLYLGTLVKFLHLHGLFPKLNVCVKCGKPNVEYISLNAGGPLCSECAKEEKDKIKYTPQMARELFFLLTKDFSQISRFKPTKDTEDLIEKMVDIHINTENEVEKNII